MPINPNIALAVKGIEVQDPLAQYGKIAAIQGAQSQNQLAQYQLSAAQREDASQNALNAAYKEAYNPQTGEVDVNKLRQSLATGGFGAKLPGVEKGLLELGKAKTEQQKAQTDLVDAKLKQSRQFLDTIDPSNPNAPQQYLAWHQANHADPVLGPVLAARGVTADQSMARIQQAIQQGPAAFAQLLNQSKLGTEKFMEMNKPQFTTQDTGGAARIVQIPGLGGPATVVAGSEVKKTITPGEAANLSIAQKRLRLDEDKAAREKDPAFQQQMAQAKAMGEAIAKGDVAAQQQLPKVLSTAEQAVSAIDTMIGQRDAKGNLIKGAKVHPGFETAVGASLLPGMRFVPGSNASDFQSYFDQVKGGAFLQAYETLKGGGAITEKEGTKAESALNRMSLAQSENEFVKAAQDFKQVIQTAVGNAKMKADRAGAAPAAPGAAPAAAPTVSNW